MKKIKKNTIFVSILVIVFTNVAVASSGSFGYHAQYDSTLTSQSIPFLSDEINGSTCAYQPGGMYKNYAYANVKIGSSSSNYHFDESYKYNDEWSGNATAKYVDGHWGQTYHKEQCYTDSQPANSKTLTYNY